jgi:hypothetical protein
MKNIITALVLTIGFTSFSQVELLNENFTTGIPATWSVIDEDNNTPGIVQYTDAWIGLTSIFDTCAASTSYYVDSNGDEDVTATSADYLITPQLSLLTFGNILTWDAKSLDGSFPDGYLVLLSTTDNLAASFTDTLKVVSEETPYWTNYSVDMAEKGYANQNVYISFFNNTTNGYALLIDNVIITGDDPASTLENEVNVSVYPNPFINELNFETEGFETVSIYNMLGELILDSNQSKVLTSDFKSGQYIAVVKTFNSVIKIKVIK